MLPIFSTANPLEAEEVQVFLRAYGIESIIIGKADDRSAAFALGGKADDPIRVMVMEEAYDEALGLLNSTPEEGEKGQLIPGSPDEV